MSMPWLKAQKWCDWELSHHPRGLQHPRWRLHGMCVSGIKEIFQTASIAACQKGNWHSIWKARFSNYFRRHFSNFQIGVKSDEKLLTTNTYLQVKQGREATWPRRLCQHSLRCPGRDSCNKIQFVHWVIVCVEASHFDCSHTGWF